MAALGLVSLSACEPRRRMTDAGVHTDTPGGGGRCGVGVTSYCAGDINVACNADGSEGGREDCSAVGASCAPGLGCRVCVPSRAMCDGNDSMRCRADGSGYDLVATCDVAAGEACIASTGLCNSPCAAAEASNSYIGCEYWPVPTTNAVSRDDFAFAVVVSNPGTTPATIRVTRGAADVATATVAPGAVQTIPLPWIDALQRGAGAAASSLVRGGAYRLRSNTPVTVYQFSPIDFRVGHDCANEDPSTAEGNDNQCFSFTNDASLLLPTHVLTGNYLALTQPSNQFEITQFDFFGETTDTTQAPGFLTLVGVDATPVSVQVTFSSAVLASADGSVRAFRSGEVGTFSLGQGDVLQLLSAFPTGCTPSAPNDEIRDAFGGVQARVRYCDTSAFDLTGTEVRATGRLAVIAGHECAFVPTNRWACDHLEEAMFPLETWGNEAIVSITQPRESEPNLVRIVSSHDDNTITFDPPSAHGPVTLARGQMVQFESQQSFRASGTDAFATAQFLVGQNYEGLEMATDLGDPSLSLAIPTAQFRSEYSFLAPTTYTESFVNVTAPAGASVMLDGRAVSGFTPVGSTGFGVARVSIPGGPHSMTGNQPFGIVVYGFGNYTSYMYPGGLDLEAIDIPF